MVSAGAYSGVRYPDLTCEPFSGQTEGIRCPADSQTGMFDLLGSGFPPERE
ncbi:MAG: hypothetical protein HN356_03115 [Calditrichaeota bacterium]|nr:hypothetical protein [Calditrichota bacterium]